MESKEVLLQTVKVWVHLDNQIKQQNTLLRNLRAEKKKQNEKMFELMKLFNIDNVDLKNGQIQYKKHTKREALTQKKLSTILSRHPQFQPEQVELLSMFVFENRKIVESETLVRKEYKE